MQTVFGHLFWRRVIKCDLCIFESNDCFVSCGEFKVLSSQSDNGLPEAYFQKCTTRGVGNSFNGCCCLNMIGETKTPRIPPNESDKRSARHLIGQSRGFSDLHNLLRVSISLAL